MKIHKKTLFQMTGYALFALVNFLFFLYLTFPFDLLEEKALRILEAESGCRISVSQSYFALPAKVSVRGLELSCARQLFIKGKPGKVTLKLKSIDLKLALLPLLFNQRGEIDIEAALFGGGVSGHLTIETKGEEETYHLAAEGKAFKLTEVDPGLSGQLALKGEGTWMDKDVSRGIASLSLSLDQGRFKEIGGWTIPVGEVSFSKTEARLSMKSGRIMLEQFSARGETVDLPNGNGSLLLRSPMNRSILNLSIRALPKGSIKEMAVLFIQGYAGQNPLKVRINGPLQRPQISLNGRPFSL